MASVLAPRTDSSTQAVSTRPGGARSRLSWVFWSLWLVTSLIGVAVVASSRDIAEESAVKALVVWVPLLVLTVLFLRWLGPDQVPATSGAARTSRSQLTLLIVAVVVPLSALGLLGPVVLVPLTIGAGVAVVVWRHDVRSAEIPVAVGFAVLATVGGSANWFATGQTNDLLFALLMFPVVTFSLLAGWAAARRAGWAGTPVGRTLVLTHGWKTALKAFGFGALVAIPWALGNIANGPDGGDPMSTWWQPSSTLMFGVAEEAWARVLLISVLFLLFRRVAQAPTALLTAALVATYWFAFVHAPGNPVGTLLLGTIFVMPMTYLYLRRGLEAAIGFHVCANLVKFVAAYLITADLWFR
jgi:hypothetical protein